MPATTSNSTQRQLLNDHDLRRRPVTLPSERFNTRATHIQFCPTNLGNSGAVTDRLPANGLEARLPSVMSVLFIGLSLRVRQSLSVVIPALTCGVLSHIAVEAHESSCPTARDTLSSPRWLNVSQAVALRSNRRSRRPRQREPARGIAPASWLWSWSSSRSWLTSPHGARVSSGMTTC
jgi:hypothetical protein